MSTVKAVLFYGSAVLVAFLLACLIFGITMWVALS